MTDEEKVKKPTAKKSKAAASVDVDATAIPDGVLDAENADQVANSTTTDTGRVGESGDDESATQIENKQPENTQDTATVEQTALNSDQVRVTNLTGRDAYCITSCTRIPKNATVVISYKDVQQKNLAIRNFEQINALRGRKQYAWEV